MRVKTTVVCALAVSAAVVGLMLTHGPVRQVPLHAQVASPGYQAPRASDGHADLNGIWQAMNTANWDLQDHAARQGPVAALGASFSVPGRSGRRRGQRHSVSAVGGGEEEAECRRTG